VGVFGNVEILLTQEKLCETNRLRTDEGMQTEVRREQPQNAPRSIRARLEPCSNVKLESLLHCPKPNSSRTVNDEGMQTEVSRRQSANADVSISESLEPVSNVKTERFVHVIKIL
jgi:hypothetical protein